MEIDEKIKIKVMDGVYNPCDDSYLLIKSINVKEGERALDMGCGTGIIALHLAKNGFKTIACDINEKAVENTMLNAVLNEIELEVIKSDLFSNVDGKFDLIAFNPPYLPTKNEDVAWSGGKEGIDIIRKFLTEAKNFLRKNGRIYMVMSSLCNIDRLKREFTNYSFRKIAEQRYFFEEIYVYLLTPLLSSPPSLP